MNKKTSNATVTCLCEETPCPMARTAALIGDQWVILLLRELFRRPHRFDELQKATSAATNIVTSRLKRMVDVGIVEKIPYQEKPVRYEYRLSKAGLGLLPLVLEMMRYAEVWMPSHLHAPTLLRHVACGKITKAGQTCSECGEALGLSNLRLEKNPLGLELPSDASAAS